MKKIFLIISCLFFTLNLQAEKQFNTVALQWITDKSESKSYSELRKILKSEMFAAQKITILNFNKNFEDFIKNILLLTQNIKNSPTPHLIISINGHANKNGFLVGSERYPHNLFANDLIFTLSKIKFKNKLKLTMMYSSCFSGLFIEAFKSFNIYNIEILTSAGSKNVCSVEQVRKNRIIDPFVYLIKDISENELYHNTDYNKPVLTEKGATALSCFSGDNQYGYYNNTIKYNLDYMSFIHNVLKDSFDNIAVTKFIISDDTNNKKHSVFSYLSYLPIELYKDFYEKNPSKSLELFRIVLNTSKIIFNFLNSKEKIYLFYSKNFMLNSYKIYEILIKISKIALVTKDRSVINNIADYFVFNGKSEILSKDDEGKNKLIPISSNINNFFVSKNNKTQRNYIRIVLNKMLIKCQ